MSEKQTLMSMLSEFSNSVQGLISEITGQKQRFADLANKVSEQLDTAKQYVLDMASSLSKAQGYERQCSEHVVSANNEALAAGRHSSDASGKAYEATQTLAQCKNVEQAVSNQVSVASSFAEQARQHSQDSGLQSDESREHADRAERAKDEAYLAVSGLAADIQELKTQLVKNNGIA